MRLETSKTVLTRILGVVCKWHIIIIIIVIIIIMYIYHARINALSAHTIHINLNTIFYTHVEIILLKGEVYSCSWQKSLTHARRSWGGFPEGGWGGGVNKTCDQYVKIIPDQVVCLERSLNGFAISLCSCFSVVIILYTRDPKSDLLICMQWM